MLRIGWFATGRGEGSRGLLRFIHDAIADGRLDARIEFVFSNREPGEAAGSDAFLALARSCGLPLLTLSSARYRRDHGGGPMAKHRAGFDRAVMRLLRDYQPDVCVLAGYMLIFGPEMCRRYPLLNLHGALPDGPVGTWPSVIRQLIASGATHTGVTVHLATEAVDRGPPLTHCVVPIPAAPANSPGAALGNAFAGAAAGEAPDAALPDAALEEHPLFRQIRAAGYRREPHLLLATLRAVAEGRLRVRPGAALDADGNPLSATYPAGLPMTAEIAAALAAADRRLR